MAIAAGLCAFAGAAAAALWNDPYPAGAARANVLHRSFAEQPKHLDPARSYSSDEYTFIAQIYEPPLQYHFLRRPYQLVPLTLAAMPARRLLDVAGRELPAGAPAAEVAFSEYEFRLKPGIRYQPHPALATDENGRYRYHALTPVEIARVHTLADFTHVGTRELRAEDYVFQVKRLADPRTHSPIAGVMKDYIVGFGEFTASLEAMLKEKPGRAPDLHALPLAGVTVVDRHTWRVRLRGHYPQFLFWQAMPFFAPVPWEADRFYGQPGLAEKNITLDWYPIGTGPYLLAENNPNLRMVLERNPEFHGETYPADGEPEDAAAGLLADAGRPLPFIERALFSLEKEAIPRWNKFLQGYYDASGIASDNFDQAIQFGAAGEAMLTDEMRARGIALSTSVATSIYYMGFNWLDEVVGGDSERARLLRRAISIAVDFEEYVSIFNNGRGEPAQGPIPPGIFGHVAGAAGINPHVYEWRDGRAVRRFPEEARRLMAQAGYPGGVDRASGQPLVLHYEATARGPDDKAQLDWMRKQFEKLGVQLVVRATDYNRFREKMLKGIGQIYMWGWNADYPDPENFLFLLYGPNAKASGGGENASNYANPEFDALFEQMKNMDDGLERQAVIDRMVAIARRDAPWLWGFFPKDFSLAHAWLHNLKPNLMANNTLKYVRLDTPVRAAAWPAWNRPIWWPVAWGGGLLLASLVPAWFLWRRREQSAAL